MAVGHLAGFGLELLPALEVRQPFMVRQLFQIVRIAKQDLREKLASDKELDEDFDGPRLARPGSATGTYGRRRTGYTARNSSSDASGVAASERATNSIGKHVGQRSAASLHRRRFRGAGTAPVSSRQSRPPKEATAPRFPEAPRKGRADRCAQTCRAFRRKRSVGR